MRCDAWATLNHHAKLDDIRAEVLCPTSIPPCNGANDGCLAASASSARLATSACLAIRMRQNSSLQAWDVLSEAVAVLRKAHATVHEKAERKRLEEESKRGVASAEKSRILMQIEDDKALRGLQPQLVGPVAAQPLPSEAPPRQRGGRRRPRQAEEEESEEMEEDDD